MLSILGCCISLVSGIVLAELHSLLRFRKWEIVSILILSSFIVDDFFPVPAIASALNFIAPKKEAALYHDAEGNVYHLNKGVKEYE